MWPEDCQLVRGHGHRIPDQESVCWLGNDPLEIPLDTEPGNGGESRPTASGLPHIETHNEIAEQQIDPFEESGQHFEFEHVGQVLLQISRVFLNFCLPEDGILLT